MHEKRVDEEASQEASNEETQAAGDNKSAEGQASNEASIETAQGTAPDGKDLVSEEASNEANQEAGKSKSNEGEASNQGSTDTRQGSEKVSKGQTPEEEASDEASNTTSEEAGNNTDPDSEASNKASNGSGQETEQEGSKEAETEDASDETGKEHRKKAKQPPRGISGLVNNSNQCFANSVLQFFDAALEGHDLNDVLGQPDTSHPFFTVPNIEPGEEFDEPVTTRLFKSLGSRLSRIRATARRLIRHLKLSGQQKHLSLKKHLRNLLDRIRRTEDNGKEEYVSAMIFQQILAFRDPVAGQQHLNGAMQEDSLEYFQAIYNGLQSSDDDEPSDEEKQCDAKLRELFTIKTEEATVCSNPECDYKGTPHTDSSNAHTVRIDKTGSKTDQSLIDLINSSVTSHLDSQWEKCGEQMLQRVTEFKEMPDNLVIHVNRIHEDQSKVMTPVELPKQTVVIGGKEYQMTAVVKHQGVDIDCGHYTAFRRRSSEWITNRKSLWFHFDDDELCGVSPSVVASDRSKGQTALVLFKAIGGS